MKNVAILRYYGLLAFLGLMVLPISAQVKSELEPGSQLKLADAVNEANVIIVGKISNAGVPSFKSDGVLVNHHVKIQLMVSLRGGFDQSKGARVTSVLDEKSPRLGQFYIFFLKFAEKSSEEFYETVKIVPATDANIADVKTLIAAAPAPQ